jgi:hypothetical protein
VVVVVTVAVRGTSYSKANSPKTSPACSVIERPPLEISTSPSAIAKNSRPVVAFPDQHFAGGYVDGVGGADEQVEALRG